MYLTIEKWNIKNMPMLLDRLVKAKDWEYVLKPYKKTRSNDQNKYYRAILAKVEEETGMDKDEIHEKMRMKFLLQQSDNPKHLPYLKSTSKLTTGEFVEYIEKVKYFFAELLGMVIPSAEEWENFYK